MVLVSRPHRCGKTTLAPDLAAERRGVYLNYDVEAHRRELRAMRLPEANPLWVFDEIHKLRG